MNRNEDAEQLSAIQQLTEIRRLVEASGRFTVLSGGASLFAGGCAVVGSLLSQRILIEAGGLAAISTRQIVHLAEIWLGVFLFACGAALIGTVRRARLEGQAVLPRLLARIGFGLVPAFLAAFLLTLAFLQRGAYDLIAPTWMLSYGIATVTAGLFSVRSVQLLGGMFLLAGALSLFLLPGQPAFTMGVTFGGFHIAYGALLWRNHGA